MPKKPPTARVKKGNQTPASTGHTRRVSCPKNWRFYEHIKRSSKRSRRGHLTASDQR
jgi:hypothetical protein